MPEQKEPPRPHGDPLEDELMSTENQAQRRSDATEDGVASEAVEDRTRGSSSDANGLSVDDEAEGAARRKRYDDGAEFVSRID